MREIASVLGLPDKPMDVEVPKDLVSPVSTSPGVAMLIIKSQHITTMSRYNSEFPFNVAFPPQPMTNVLAEWLSKKGIKQSHIAGSPHALHLLTSSIANVSLPVLLETEKYAHVTFFFNGGVEKQFEDEERHLIPSPKVATYDKDPKMSVQGVADKVAEVLKKGDKEFVMCNFAPPDMVSSLTRSYPHTIAETYIQGRSHRRVRRCR
jgi:2,3-bisphosphoglycerate-independent phosphoglycerate mutase